MAEQETTKNESVKSFGTADEEIAKIQADKEAIHQVQKEAAESHSEAEWTARHSTSVNASNEEPIDPQMPEMPPE